MWCDTCDAERNRTEGEVGTSKQWTARFAYRMATLIANRYMQQEWWRALSAGGSARAVHTAAFISTTCAAHAPALRTRATGTRSTRRTSRSPSRSTWTHLSSCIRVRSSTLVLRVHFISVSISSNTKAQVTTPILNPHSLADAVSTLNINH